MASTDGSPYDRCSKGVHTQTDTEERVVLAVVGKRRGVQSSNFKASSVARAVLQNRVCLIIGELHSGRGSPLSLYSSVARFRFVSTLHL